MPERDGYAPGTPSWVDLSSSDVGASAAFYGALFGWEHQSAGPAEETGGYGFFLKGGKMVAGVGPKMNEQQPTVWTTYVSTDDAQSTAEKVSAAGGQILLEPMAVMDVGHMGVFMDPTGAAIATWQPGRHKGAELVSEPGALVWNELHTRDVDAAKAFYGAVFGWEGDTNEMSPGVEYTMWKLGGEMIGGMAQMNANMPADVPPHWLVYFGTEDTDAAVERISELGGSIAMAPMTIPAGRFAVAADPLGTHFGVFQGAQSS
jgi:predicted enzyme related to lactoylglutathione lyase